jgi:thiol:disulfide interchange protein
MLIVALLLTACAAPAVQPTARPVVTLAPRPTLTAAPSAAFIRYDPELDVPAAIKAALAEAKGDGKRILLEFGTDDCPDCHVLGYYLADEHSRATLDAHYHAIRIDVGKLDKNLATVERYGDLLRVGIPVVVILDADGTKLVDTAAGELKDSRRYKAKDVAAFLEDWAT